MPSIRKLLCLMFGVTCCWGFLKGLIEAQAFIGLAVGDFTGYQMKTRIGENILYEPNRVDKK